MTLRARRDVKAAESHEFTRLPSNQPPLIAQCLSFLIVRILRKIDFKIVYGTDYMTSWKLQYYLYPFLV